VICVLMMFFWVTKLMINSVHYVLNNCNCYAIHVYVSTVCMVFIMTVLCCAILKLAVISVCMSVCFSVSLSVFFHCVASTFMVNKHAYITS